MRDYNTVSTTIWRSQKFSKRLKSDSHKLLYFYILTSPHRNPGGCYDLPIGYGAADLKWSMETFREAIGELQKVGLIEFDEEEETIYLVNWHEFEFPTNTKHALGIAKGIAYASSARLKLKAFQDLAGAVKKKKWKVPDEIESEIDRLSKGYRKGIAPEPEPEPNPEPEPEPEPDRSDADASAVPALNADNLQQAVEDWNSLAEKLGLSKVQKLTKARNAKLRARLRDCGGIDGWREALGKIARSSFLIGENNRGWKASFDFLLQESSFTKLMEGVYENRSNGQGSFESTMRGIADVVGSYQETSGEGGHFQDTGGAGRQAGSHGPPETGAVRSRNPYAHG